MPYFVVFNVPCDTVQAGIQFYGLATGCVVITGDVACNLLVRAKHKGPRDPRIYLHALQQYRCGLRARSGTWPAAISQSTAVVSVSFADEGLPHSKKESSILTAIEQSAPFGVAVLDHRP